MLAAKSSGDGEVKLCDEEVMKHRGDGITDCRQTSPRASCAKTAASVGRPGDHYKQATHFCCVFHKTFASWAISPMEVDFARNPDLGMFTLPKNCRWLGKQGHALTRFMQSDTLSKHVVE